MQVEAGWKPPVPGFSPDVAGKTHPSAEAGYGWFPTRTHLSLLMLFSEQQNVEQGMLNFEDGGGQFASAVRYPLFDILNFK